MAYALSTYNSHLAVTNSTKFIRGAAKSQTLHFLSGTQHRSRRISQLVPSLTQHICCRIICPERWPDLGFLQREGFGLSNVHVSEILPYNKLRCGSRCRTGRLNFCFRTFSSIGLLAQNELPSDFSSRMWNLCVECRRHALSYWSQYKTRMNIRRRASPVDASSSVSEAFGITESGFFSISNDELLSRGFELQSSSEGIDLDQLNSLFLKVGFPRRQKEKLARALQHTLSLFWLKSVKSDKMIAFARATGDNVFNAIIWDVVVDPSYQGIGLGKAVIERLMADLVKRGISNIALYAEPRVVGFYKPLGFISDPDGIKAMAYSRRRR